MLKPILLISEVFYWQANEPGLYRRVIDTVSDHDFYRGVETVVVPDPEERKSLRTLCDKHELTLLQWLTKSLLDRKLSLASIDESERVQAVRCVTDAIDLAHDAGAFGIGLVSGADPGPDLRSKAQQAFRESAKAIAAYLEKKGMAFIIETLDRDQHKKQVLGPTSEGVELIRELRSINQNAGLCWDTAHVALMGEDFPESLACAAGSALQMHLANAVLDPASYFYGDHHIAPGGELGFLTQDKAEETLRQVVQAGAAGPHGITRVGVEARTLPGNNPWANERHCRQLLRQALAALQQETGQ